MKKLMQIINLEKVSDLFLNAEFSIWIGSKNHNQTTTTTTTTTTTKYSKVYATFKPWHMIYPGFSKICNNKL